MEKVQQANGGFVKDKLSGKEWHIKAKTVINATGPFCDAIRYQETADKASFQELVAPSLGAHLVLGNWSGGHGIANATSRTGNTSRITGLKGRTVFFPPF